MSDEHDPFEMLVQALKAGRDELECPPADEVVARLVHAPRRRRRRRRAIAAAIVALAIGGGGAVAWAVLHRERAASPAIVQCLREADLSGSSAIVSANGLDPLTRCAQEWDERVSEWGPRPPLVGCVSAAGAPLVVPGDEATCGALGLPNLDPSLTPTQERMVRMQSELGELLGADGCVPGEEAAAIAREQIRKHQLDGWQVELDGSFTREMPCGAPRFDPMAETVYILPIPDFTTSAEGE